MTKLREGEASMSREHRRKELASYFKRADDFRVILERKRKKAKRRCEPVVVGC